MGLTIHYEVRPDPEWKAVATVRSRLQEVHSRTKELPALAVTDLVVLRGKACRWSDDEEVAQTEEHRWAKIQASRSVETPYEPGTSMTQPADYMMFFTINVADGSEPMSVGYVRHPKYIWKAHGEDEVTWQWAYTERDRYPASYKLISEFANRWKLMRVANGPSTRHSYSGSIADHCCQYTTKGSWLDHHLAAIWKGPYQSHRRGYGKSHGYVRLCNARRLHGIPYVWLRSRKSAEDAERDFNSPAFQDDFRKIAHGQDHVIEASAGEWSSFCKTIYAGGDEYGGPPNFVKAHLIVCAVLQYAQEAGFQVDVYDEGHFWEHQDRPHLVSLLTDWDRLRKYRVEGLLKLLKEANGDFSCLDDPVSVPEKVKQVAADVRRRTRKARVITPEESVT